MDEADPLPSVEAFRDALAKGLGRTMLALREPDGAARCGEALIAGCVESLRYGNLFEADRAPYLFRLLEEARLVDDALVAILGRLPATERERDREQMLDLLKLYAERAEERAWDALFERAIAGESHAWSNLADLGTRGLEWLADHVVPSLPEEEWYRLIGWLPNKPEDDATPTQKRLRTMADRYRADARERSRKDPWGSLPTRVFLDRLSEEGRNPMSAFEFARRASRQQGREAAERLLAETNARALRQLIRVFRDWSYPLPVRRLFAHATDETRGWAVCEVLGTMDSPAVRHFARRMLRRRPIPWNALGAWKASVYPGDEAAILDALPAMEEYGRGYLNNTAADLTIFMHDCPEGAWAPHAEWVYEHAPRSSHRLRAVEWMFAHGTLSDFIREEGIHDADPKIRELCAERRAEEPPFARG